MSPVVFAFIMIAIVLSFVGEWYFDNLRGHDKGFPRSRRRRRK
jgi:hypothetical protein